MKAKLVLSAVALGLLTVFSSCTKDTPTPEKGSGSSFVINYGSYGGDKGSISAFDSKNDTLTNKHYQAVNGAAMASNPQYAYQLNNKVYFMGNNLDQVFWVDAETFEQTGVGVTEGIIKPRYCVADGDMLYVSCWGGDIWVDNTLSYIAKFNTATNKVEGKIKLDGGPEGLAIANGKLYAALNYKDSVAVISLADDAISYIATPAVTSYFIKDKNNNLYVSLIDSYSNPATKTGLGYINTATDKLDAVYEKEGVSSSYVNILAFSSDWSKLYVQTSVTNADWSITGYVEVFNTDTKAFETKPLISGIDGINGLAVDPATDNVICFVSESVNSGGSMNTYKPDGTFVKSYVSGIAPYMMLTVN